MSVTTRQAHNISPGSAKLWLQWDICDGSQAAPLKVRVISTMSKFIMDRIDTVYYQSEYNAVFVIHLAQEKPLYRNPWGLSGFQAGRE